MTLDESLARELHTIDRAGLNRVMRTVERPAGVELIAAGPAVREWIRCKRAYNPLVGRRDAIYVDRLDHASLIDGVRQLRSRMRITATPSELWA